MPRPRTSRLKQARRWLGVLALALAVGYLATVVDFGSLGAALEAVGRSPGALLGAVVLYAGAFALRSWAWTRVLPTLPYGQSWAALHVSLLGNHVLPFRLGEALRVTSVLRRTGLPAAPVTASAVALRAADLLAVLALAVVGAPAVANEFDAWGWVLAAVLLAAGVAAVVLLLRLKRRGAAVRMPGLGVAAAASVAWLLEAAVMWAAASAAGISLTYPQAVAVTAVTIAAQTIAVTPGGIGGYEAAATAALVGLGAGPGAALAAALVAHATKTAYSLVVGGVALVTPAPGYFGRLRLSRALPPRPAPVEPAPDAPIVAVIPVYNEEATVGDVVRRLPSVACGRPVRTVVVDDGSTDASAERARAAGATVLPQPRNLGLGAAVRRALAEATALRPACVVYLDADGEYAPEELAVLAAPVLAGRADYVIGSRFAGGARRMTAHRTAGNRLLTHWVRWMTRRRDLTDGQSGYRAFSADAAAAAEIVHDYNYAQVLTLDLLGKGYAYAEVPITYAFRTSGSSFIRLGTYLRKVLPAVHRELNGP
ncbi:MAG TPA: lysylphosphatidylglycerol synthase domain-containing protein [Mycobacteriales bacterium]|nr:lysylphosphatidylglycerol synthase domain-containing protein [Mycobacteriales bacterium]